MQVNFKNPFLPLLGLLACLCPSLYGETPHAPHPDQARGLVVQYKLIDLGETDLDPEDLTKFKSGPSLSPAINNSCEVIANRKSGGFIYKPGHGDYVPCINGATFNFYALNNKGDILVGIRRGQNSLEWLVWPTGQGWNCQRLSIDTCELEGSKVALGAINDCRLVVGDARPWDGRSLPVIWYPDPRWGLRRIGYFQGMDFTGTAQGINNSNLVVGKSYRCLERFPFVWDGCRLADLAKYRSRFNPPSDGRIEFEDAVIDNAGIVYGTYWINRSFLEPSTETPEHLLAFIWDPAAGHVRLADLQGMRLAAVNACRRLVGSLKGKAVYWDEGYQPTEILAAMPVEETKGWELLEATGINDCGQIVGYGRLNGKVHVFIADPQ